MKAVMMRMRGGLDALSLVELPELVTGPGQVLVEVAAAGVNFMDIGVRQGLYWTEMPNPKVLGVEGVGTVIAAGDGAGQFVAGQRVAWAYAPGSYAERVSVPASALVRVPDGIDDRTAASVMMQGLTASHFATDFYPVQPRVIALVHAAAGGFYDHVHTPALLQARAGQLFEWIAQGKLRVAIGETYPLADAARAHAALESRGTTGKLLLVP